MATVADIQRVHDLQAAGEKMSGFAVIDTDPCGCDVCIHTRSIPVGHAQPAVVDGKTVHGPWAKMCLGCFRDIGIGLGVGRGQVLVPVAD